MITRELKTVQIDTEKGICLVNGEDVSMETHELHLSFENGLWSLTTSSKKYYASPVTREVTMEEILK